MKKSQVIVLHLVFWTLFFLVPELPVIFPDKKYPLWVFYYEGTTQLLNILNFYVCYFLIAYLIFKLDRMKASLVILFFFILVFSVARLFAVRLVYTYVLGMEELPKLRFYNIMMELVNSLLFSLLPLAMRFVIEWFDTRRLRAEMMAQSKMSELALLRSQINPHFLFNTLNNLYSLVYKKSDEAPSVVMKPSEIMRYMLYEANADKVPLEKEIQYLQSFIQLQQLRLHTDKFIDFRVEGNVEGRYIAPMMLIPFVENAFKHGKKSVKAPGISILLKVTDKSIEFEVCNYCQQNSASPKDPQSGIGLQNVQRRLELIYPGKHSMSVEPCGDQFRIKLQINES
jgi:two-component system, LytTR family, sensor kinase